MNSAPNSPMFRYRLDLILLALLPLLVLATNPNIPFANAGGCDAWGYTSFRWVYLDYLKTEGCPMCYMLWRPLAVWPQFLLNQVFRPFPTHFIYFFLLFYTALFSFYLALRKVLSVRAALLGAVLLGMSPLFVGAFAPTHVTGTGVVLICLTLWFSLEARQSRRDWFWLTLAGAAFAGVAHTHLYGILVAGPAALFYFLPLSSPPGRRLGRKILRFCVFIILGMVLITLFLALVYKFILRSDFYFFLNQTKLVFWYAHVHRETHWQKAGWFLRSSQMVLLLVVWLAALAYMLRRRIAWRDALSSELSYPILYLFAMTLIGFTQLRGYVLLEYDSYSIYLTPLVFLALLVVTPNWRRLEKSRWYWAALAACLLLGLYLNHAYWTRSAIFFEKWGPWQITLPMLVGAGVVGLAFLLWRFAWGQAVAVVAVALLLFGLLPGPYASNHSLPWTKGGKKDFFEQYQEFFTASEFLASLGLEKRPKFWVEGISNRAHIISRTQRWCPAVHNEFHFPALKRGVFKAGDLVVILTYLKDRELAQLKPDSQRNMDAFHRVVEVGNRALAARGLVFRPFAHRILRYARPINIVVGELHALPKDSGGGWQPRQTGARR